MRGTRFGGSPRARFRSKSARSPLCANLVVTIVSRSGTFYSAAKYPDARQPTAERLHDRGALRRGRGPGDGARLAPAHRRCARGRRTGRRPTAATLRRPAPRPRRLLQRRPERVARDRRGGGTSDRAPARPRAARARPERTPPPVLGCTTSRAEDEVSRIAASMFTKSTSHAAMREYRFVIFRDRDAAERVLLRISGMMRDALVPTTHGLVRAAPPPASPEAATKVEAAEPTRSRQWSEVRHMRATSTERIAERRAHEMIMKGTDGRILASESCTSQEWRDPRSVRRGHHRPNGTERHRWTDQSPAAGELQRPMAL